jgi:hypothetical protein
MMKPHHVLVPALLSVAAIGCTSGDSVKWVAGFDPPPVADGYTRFITPTVKDITPGYDQEWCQWIAAPSDTDQDVLALTGAQSKTGHHAIVYATTETNFKVGESHICTVADMVSISFIGGVGAEGSTSASEALPENVYFRVPKGKALMANTHWLNETDDTVAGQAYLDLKLAPPSNDRIIADLFANNGDTFTIAPDAVTSYDTSCVLQQDLQFAAVSNHMHTLGMTAYSELIHADGTKQTIVTDNPWNAEEQFNPNWTKYTLAAPLMAVKGDTYHTHCEWSNDGTSSITFPDEMCTGVGFYFPSQGTFECDDGSW